MAEEKQRNETQPDEQVVHAQVEKPEDFLLPDAAAVTARFVMPRTDDGTQSKSQAQQQNNNG